MIPASHQGLQGLLDGDVGKLPALSQHFLSFSLRIDERLETKYADTLGDQGKDYLSRMKSANRRMQTLINDLLTYSRVSAKAQPFVPVNLAEITREVLADLETPISAYRKLAEAIWHVLMKNEPFAPAGPTMRPSIST